MLAPRLALTPNESALFELLTSCAKWIDETNALSPLEDLPDAAPAFINWKAEQDSIGVGRERVQLRVAGGWVRDKLLGRPSHDIDISTSPYPLTGFAFADLLRKYLIEVVDQPEKIGKIAKIDANPLQSKHLETATVPILGFSVDFVQLRGGEMYDEGSRIPNAVSFGTPLEDAERRDLTINALFYNLHSELVEDHTERGLLDLGLEDPSTRLIRTPLPPFQTFRDDPLRVVRAVRFASRFGDLGFQVDQELKDAIQREEIRDALRDSKKISRERVGTELEKMLKSHDPLLAIKLIEELNLYSLIFLYEPADVIPVHQPVPDPSISVTAATILHFLITPAPSRPILHPFITFTTTSNDPPKAILGTTPLLLNNSTSLRRMYLTAALLPVFHLQSIEKKRPIWLGEKLIRDGIKGANMDRIWVGRAREASHLIKVAVKEYGREGRMKIEEDRAELGMLLRNPFVHDMGDETGARASTWNMSVLWSLVADLILVYNDSTESARVIKSYNTFVERIEELELHERAFDKPLLNGSEVNALLPQTKNSPATTIILALIVRYQIAHPQATKQLCEQWLIVSKDVLEVLANNPVKEKKGPQKKRKE